MSELSNEVCKFVLAQEATYEGSNRMLQKLIYFFEIKGMELANTVWPIQPNLGRILPS